MKKTKINAEEADFSDILSDDCNANRGTPRGRFQLEESIRDHGFLEAGTLDKNNRLIGGNKRTEVAHEIGLAAPLIIDVDGTRPVYLRHKHIDLDTKEGRAAALALNRVAQTSIDLDPAIVLQYGDMGVDLSKLYHPEEIDTMLADLKKLGTPEAPKTPEGDAAVSSIPEKFLVIVTCASDPEQAELLEKLTGEGYECRALVS